MKYAVEMGSGTTIYVPSSIKIGSAIQTLMGGGYIDTQKAWRSHKPSIFLQKKERRLKNKYPSTTYSVARMYFSTLCP
jgi:hypothetical protein